MIFSRSLEERSKRRLVFKKNKWYVSLQAMLVLLWVITFSTRGGESLIDDVERLGILKEFLITFAIINIIVVVIVEIIYYRYSKKLTSAEIEAIKPEIVTSFRRRINFIKNFFKNVVLMLTIFLIIGIVLWFAFQYINNTG